jgi:enterochelin esterase-like enzyme
MKFLLVLIACASQASEPVASSPRLAAVRDAATFWKSADSPIVERIPGSTDVLVTFVAHQQVAISSQLCEGRGDCADPTARLAGTDIWYRTYRLRGDLRIGYSFAVAGKEIRDPLNPRALAQGWPFGESILELPDAPPQPWHVRRDGAPAGTISELAVGDRAAWIYTPPAYDASRTYPLLVCFDGPVYLSANGVPGPTILDNLIAQHRIAPLIAVFVAQRPQPQRNIELDNNPQFLAYVTDRLLPAVRARWHATTDPRDTIVCGSSSGGLASAYFAFRRPDVYGNVLSQSGAFWPGETRDNPEREWLTRQYAASPRLPVRFVVQVGILEHKPTPGNGPSILATNRHLRAVLIGKGYEVYYTEVAGGHEPLSWRGGFADGLLALRSR